MYKLLIVEDEDLIRNAIVTGVDWNKLGFTVMSAEDGEAAIAVAEAFRPDIVLTDIRMPFIDGLELTRLLKRDYPDTIVVILSGHDEFSYAQEAVQLGVKKYIRKPIIPSELIHIMKEMADVLRARDTRVQHEKKLRAQVQQSLPFLRERLLNQLLHNMVSADRIQQMLDFTGLHLRGQAYTVCLIDCKPDPPVAGEDAAILSLSLTELISREIGTDGVTFETPSDKRVLIYAARTKESERSYVVGLLGDISDAIFDTYGIITTCAIGTRVDAIGEIHISYESAKDAYEQSIFGGRGKIYDAYESDNIQSYYPFDRAQALLDKVKLQSDDEFSAAFDGFFSDMRSMRALTHENILAVMLDLVNCGQRLLLESGIAGGEDMHAVYTRLFSLTTLDQFQEAILSYFQSLRRRLEGQRASRSNQLIEQVCAYIAAHYCEPTLSLNTVASSVFISPTYLSILFKKVMGTTFIDYVSRLRMEAAKTLLAEENLRTYEAAGRTGYSDPQYFSSCFKRYSGMTPSEYKSLYRTVPAGEK